MNSLSNLRQLLKTGYDIYPGQGQQDDFQTFDARPYQQAFEQVQFSEAHWYAIYETLKEKLIHKSLDLNLPWVDHAYLLANKQGRHQGYIDINREAEEHMARQDGTIFWNENVCRTILDHQIARPEVKEKVPGLYITKNKTCMQPFLTHQTDGRLSQMNKYESGQYQSEYAQPNMGIFFTERALQYENPDDDTAVSMKALVKIQVEQDVFPYKKPRDGKVGYFHEKMCHTASDKVDKIKVQITSITKQVKRITCFTKKVITVLTNNYTIGWTHHQKL